MSLISSRRFAALVLAAATLAGGACAGGGGKVDLSDGDAAAAAAIGRTREAGTARFTLDYDGQLAGPLKVSGAGSFDFGENKGAIDIKLNDQATQAVVVDNTVYGKLPGLLGQGAKPWFSYDLLSGGPLVGGFDQLLRLADPRQALDRLELAKDMKRVGEEKVRGVDTVHFRGVIDVSEKTLAGVDDDTAEPVRELREAYGLAAYPVDLWLDGEGRVRRMASQFSGKSGDREVSARTQVELFNFGDKVSVSVPPPGQVQDASLFGTPSRPATTAP